MENNLAFYASVMQEIKRNGWNVHAIADMAAGQRTSLGIDKDILDVYAERVEADKATLGREKLRAENLVPGMPMLGQKYYDEDGRVTIIGYEHSAQVEIARLNDELTCMSEATNGAAQITMGRGLVDVTRIDYDGRSGILFRPRDRHIPVGEMGELQAGEYWPVAGDVVIWIENGGGASVIDQHLRPFLPEATEGADLQAHHSKPVVSQNTQIVEDKATEGGAHEKGWQPIETAPKGHRQDILIFDRGVVRIAWWGAAAYNRKTKEYDLGWTNGGTYGFQPSHWMPLPSAPAALTAKQTD